MATDPWLPTSEDISQVRAFLRGPLCASPEGSACWLPGLAEVLVTHLEDGFVHLAFIGWPLPAARAVADQVLHPDALQVSGQDLLGVFAPAFEGLGWKGQPPQAVLVRRRPGPPWLCGARSTPVGAEAPR